MTKELMKLSLFVSLMAFSWQGFSEIVNSGKLDGNSAPKKIAISLKNAKVLYLITTDGGNGNGNDHAVWGNPTLTTKDGKQVLLTKLKPVKVQVGWNKLCINKSYDNKPLSIGSKLIKYGFWAHSPSVLAFKIDKKYVKFEALVGLQKGHNGRVEFILNNTKPEPPMDVIPQVKTVKLAIEDLMMRFPEKYSNGKKYLEILKKISAMPNGDKKNRILLKLQHTALLDNPLLKRFDKILAVRRHYGSSARQVINTCIPNMNTYSLEQLRPGDGNEELVTVNDFLNSATPKLLYKPAKGGHIATVDLHFNGDKIMYSGLGSEGRWHLHEIDENGKYIRQLTPTGLDYNSFDSCYLPDGNIIFTSTAPIQGLPCEAGRLQMSNTYLLNPEDSNIRRLTFDQDANWAPTVMEDGRVMFLRWEYSDIPHFYTRIIMTMNPDGSKQNHFYGSNSYWPNSANTPKPIPGSPGKFIAVISGHHNSRPGPLCLFDSNKGRHEASGAVQLLPGYGKKVVPIIKDHLYSGVYPKFQNPIPLGKNEKDGAGTYFLVSCKPTPTSLWGIYLIDVFDNIVKIAEQDGCALNEPIPFCKTKMPRQVPSMLNLKSKEATIYIANIYEGPGLKNVAKGSVKHLRLFTYHYSYYKSGSHEVVGCESSWDVKRVLGTVPVHADGSVMFRVPANMPISIQPLDKNGAALQLMRSWITAMPGEVLSCIGCHEDPNSAVGMRATATKASRQRPTIIKGWQGAVRNFSFLREVQPVLHKRCIGCHNPNATQKMSDGKVIPDFKTTKLEALVYEDQYKKRGDAGGGPFSVSYNNLNPYTRRPGPESDYHLFNPLEYHVNTSYLIQHLQKGHHSVELTTDEWEKLYTWIDLNVPFWGSWTDAHRDWTNTFNMRWAGCGKNNAEQLENIKKYRAQRNRLQKMYANFDEKDDPENDLYSLETAQKHLVTIKTVFPKGEQGSAILNKVAGWPFSANSAKAETAQKIIKVPGGSITMRKIPAGTFIMGANSAPNTEKAHLAKVKKSFWIASKELTNRLYQQFDAEHESKYMDILGKDQTSRGVFAEHPEQPVIRVSWTEATAFAKWLSTKTGRKFRLPTEIEWEYAARAGTDTPFYWGDETADFANYANLADKTIEKFNARQTYNYYLRENKFNDHAQIQVSSGKYKPNAFGLYDMIGNVAEWTSSSANSAKYHKISRGGSWHSLPRWAGVHKQVLYHQYQRVYNVGIRLVMDE